MQYNKKKYREPNATSRACMGAVALVNDFNSVLVPSGFIRKLLFGHIPSYIQHGLRHVGFCKLDVVHIADNEIFLTRILIQSKGNKLVSPKL
jgi:hypothetical protein